MKKTLIFALIAILILLLAACSCYSENTVDPYNTAVREGWDIYATLNCFVKTEYNKDGNPIVRSLYSTETWENGLTVYYQYDKDGYLCELSMDGKSVGGSYFKNLRFDLSFGEDNLTQTGRPLHGSQAYERVSFTWDENRKLVSEFAKPSFISDFTYDEKGGITKEHYSESEKELTHRYNESGILITEVDSLTEKMSVTFGENGMPASLKSADYTTEYTYNKDNLCTKIDIKALGQKVSDVVISYDEKGNPIKREVTVHEGGKTVLAALYEYVYDEKGNMTKETISQVNASLELKIVSDVEHSYNDNGDILEETQGSYSSPGNLTAIRNTVHEYDKAGNRIGSTTVHTNVAGTVIRSKGSERYYTNGKLLSKTAYAFHANHTLKETVETEYSQERLVLKKTTRDYWQGEKVDGVLVDGKLRSVRVNDYTDEEVIAKTQYKEYTKDGLLSSKQTTTYADGNRKSHLSMEYYSNGSVREKIAEEYYDNSAALKYRETVSYTQDGVVSDRSTTENDEKGNPLKLSQLQMGGTEKEYEQVHEFTLYANGAVKTVHMSQIYCGVLKYMMEYEFDTEDRCVKYVRNEYQNGKISTKEELFYDNGQLQKTIVYQYDENGNEISREETVNP
ncbi:MAG: hypothetical protein IKM34_05975 [Clostridia bacterium]|nr:hypothetical protein [Clostridia bacterium]